MKIGLVFPQTEFGHDPGAVKAYAQLAESLGLSHVLAYDHILSANPDRPGGWHGPYTHEHPFLEPFVLFSFMAAVTENLGFATGILISPQRETAVIAKQAATLDVLCNGRLRLGLGVGWNKVEYIGLNQDFHTRGRRMTAQVKLLKKLWTEPLITHEDEWHNIPDAGLNPLPIQQPIPIWFGGSSDAVLRRIAQHGDGWMPNFGTAKQAQPTLEKLDGYLEGNGRLRSDLGIEPRLHLAGGNPDRWHKAIIAWQAAGATHFSFNTMNAGLTTPQQHMDAIQTFAKTIL